MNRNMEAKNKGLVGIVVVSHSNTLAEEVISFVKVFKQEDFALENGGNSKREVYGTNVENVKQAIIRADKGAGVLVFVDMGSSVFNAVKAIKELEGQVEAKIADAPFLEGVISIKKLREREIIVNNGKLSKYRNNCWNTPFTGKCQN